MYVKFCIHKVAIVTMIETEGKLQHLFHLLDDESPSIRRILLDTLLSNSLDLVLKRPCYERECPPGFLPVFEELLQTLHTDLVMEAFRKLICSNAEDIDLEKAVMLLSYWNDPGISIPSLTRQLDRMAEEIESRLPFNGHPLTLIDHIGFYIFKKNGFRGNTTDYYNPDNSFMDRVLKTRKGIPITLSVLFMLIARRMGLPVMGVPMPAHFIAKFDNGQDELFFDSFYEGKIYSRLECQDYLNQANVENDTAILDGCPDYQIVVRMLRNIHLVYSSYREDLEKNSLADQLISLIDPHYQE
jgi:regulator of sirC expression with transglutaminase-like and TPR domain